jgi:hypothetical protein
MIDVYLEVEQRIDNWRRINGFWRAIRIWQLW